MICSQLLGSRRHFSVALALFFASSSGLVLGGEAAVRPLGLAALGQVGLFHVAHPPPTFLWFRLLCPVFDSASLICCPAPWRG